MTSIEELIEIVKKDKKFRLKHSLGVMHTATEMAEIHGEDVEKMKVAGLLHDYAKKHSNQELRDFVIEFNISLDPMLVETSDLCHGPVGAELIKRDFNIYDEEILNAIRYHTFTDRNMTQFDYILYLADIIEPNRKIFHGFHKLKKLAYTDLEEAMIYALSKSIKHIIDKGEKVYEESVLLRNILLDKESD